MIITDVAQIDCIAKEVFGTTTGIVSVDMNDYEFIKEHSQSLKLIKLEVPSLTEGIVHSLDEAIVEVGKENVYNVILYINADGSDTGIRAITVEQLNMLIDALNKHLETANIIWGMGDDNENAETVSILVILGYGK